MKVYDFWENTQLMQRIEIKKNVHFYIVLYEKNISTFTLNNFENFIPELDYHFIPELDHILELV